MRVLIFLCLLLTSIRVFSGSLEQEIRLHLSLPAEQVVKAGYLTFPKEHPIDHSTYLYVKYALEAFRKEGVSFVLLHLDTPGGEVFAALGISEELKKMDAEYHIPVVAYVDPWALSAGALLAYSCRWIVATKDSSMGAAEPVLISSEGAMEKASEKMVSALRVEFMKAAECYGRNPLLAEAMVDRDVILVQREGTILQLMDSSQILLEGDHPDLVINAKGKLLTLDGRQMEEFHVSNFLVDGKGEEGMIRWIPYSNWKISFFAFLGHPLVSSLLMMGLMVGVYGVFQGQVLGVSSVIGLICLGLLLLSSFSVEVIDWLGLLLLLVGLGLFFVDVWALSGFGLLGALGLFLLFGGIIDLLLPSLEGVDFSWDPSSWGVRLSEWIFRLSLFLTTLFVSLVMILFLGRFLLQRKVFMKRFILEEPPIFEEVATLVAIGERGTTYTALRPFGKVLIHDKLYEAKTEGLLMAQGTPIEVVGQEPGRLIVKEIQ